MLFLEVIVYARNHIKYKLKIFCFNIEGTRKVCEHKASRGIFQGSYFESEQEEIVAPINEKKTNKSNISFLKYFYL